MKKHLGLVFLCLLLAGLLVACGGGTGGSTPVEGTTAGTVVETTGSPGTWTGTP